MTTVSHEDRQKHLISCRATAERARQGGDPRELSLALIGLGSALFQTRVFDQGVAALDEAEELANSLGDLPFLAHCLGLKAAVYQEAGRFHNAYEVIERVVEMAQAHNDLGMKCDALVAQGQILANSGDPIVALEKLQAARSLANEIDDKRHLMKVFGTLGNVETSRAALDNAQVYFEIAAAWAAKLDERLAECGYLLNLGTVLGWQGLLPQALEVFQRVLNIARDTRERDAELAALQHLTQCLHSLKQYEQVVPLARNGIAVSQELGRHDFTFSFFETTALAHFQLGKHNDALGILQEAAEYARSANDPNHEANMLLQLGESYLAMELYEQALAPFEAASRILSDRGHEADNAHAIGKIGVALAESGRVDEAIIYHQRALELARQNDIAELEAGQLIMLALAYRDQHNLERASECSRNAAALFSSIGLIADANRAHQLFTEVSAL